MKNSFKVSLLTIGLSICSYGQVTIQSTELNPTIGETFSISSANWIPEGNSGNNVTWDFSAMQPNVAIIVDYAAGAATFPLSNIKQTTSAGGQSSVAHIDASNTGQYIYGIEGGGTVITYQDAMKTMSFPLNDAVYETDNFSATFVSGGFNFTRVGTSQIFADAWGTLITPEGTFTDVIRVRLTLDYVDTYSGGTYTTSSTTYAWYKAGVHYALASISELSTDTGAPTQYSAQYLTNVNLGVEEQANNVISLYPNPVSSQLIVETDNNSNLAYIEVYTMLGQQLRSKEVSEQSTIETIDFSDLQEGVYWVRLMDKQHQTLSSQKIIRE